MFGDSIGWWAECRSLQNETCHAIGKRVCLCRSYRIKTCYNTDRIALYRFHLKTTNGNSSRPASAESGRADRENIFDAFRRWGYLQAQLVSGACCRPRPEGHEQRKLSGDDAV